MSSPFYAEGRYNCEIVTQGLSEASTGTPQFVLRIKVLETEAGEQLPAQYERTIYRSITENTMPYFLEDLKTLGYEHDSFKFLDPNQPDFQDFKGKIIVAFCTHENNPKGGTREKWGIASTMEFEVKPIENAKLRELDNLFGRQLKGLASSVRKTGSASKPISTTARPGIGVSDDDIPF